MNTCNICAATAPKCLVCPACNYISCIKCTRAFWTTRDEEHSIQRPQCAACRAFIGEDVLAAQNIAASLRSVHRALCCEAYVRQERAEPLLDQARLILPAITEAAADIAKIIDLRRQQVRLECQSALLQEAISHHETTRRLARGNINYTALYVHVTTPPGSITARIHAVYQELDSALEEASAPPAKRRKADDSDDDAPPLPRSARAIPSDAQLRSARARCSAFLRIPAHAPPAPAIAAEARPAKLAACPVPDCAGHIVDKQCDRCCTPVCATCRRACLVDHVCAQDDIASLAYLASTSKPCPSCSTPCDRIDGCAHMWCPACHTHFNWLTLKITAPTHNPMYSAFLTSQAALAGPVPPPAACPDGVFPPEYIFVRFLPVIAYSSALPRESQTVNGRARSLQSLFRFRHHTLDMPFMQVVEAPSNNDLRVRLVQEQITPALFASRAAARFRKAEHANAVRLHAQAFVAGAEHILRDFMRDAPFGNNPREAAKFSDPQHFSDTLAVFDALDARVAALLAFYNDMAREYATSHSMESAHQIQLVASTHPDLESPASYFHWSMRPIASL